MEPLFFNSSGLLNPRDYELTFEELRSSLLVVGPGQFAEPDWDMQWRLHLVNQAEILVKQLWQIGVTDIFFDGSFVEQKAHPNDIDGYFVYDDLMSFVNGDMEHLLNMIDPHKIWTWNHNSRKAYKGYMKKQLPMWHKYRVELYPHIPAMNKSANSSGMLDEHGNELEFPAAFRRCRSNGVQKGIIKIVR
jgi:hypothetical protein